MKKLSLVYVALLPILFGCNSSDDSDDTPQNSAPIAMPDVATVNQGDTVTIDVLANDVDPNGDALTLVAAENLEIKNNQVSYVSAEDDTPGEKVFTYRITDGLLESTSTLTITIVQNGQPPQPPVAEAEYVTAQTCKTCHTNIYNEWKDTRHAQDYRTLYTDDPNKTIEKIIPELDWGTEAEPITHTIKFKPNNQITTYKGDDGKYYATLIDQVDAANSQTYRIDGISATTSKQFVSYDYPQKSADPQDAIGLMMPFAWYNDGNAQWFSSFYTGSVFWNNDGSLKKMDDIHTNGVPVSEELHRMSWENQCMQCHTTNSIITGWEKTENYGKGGVPGMLVSSANMHSGDVEDGISCEKCHNAGSNHATSMNADDITNPGKMTLQQKNDSCIQCHQMSKHHDLHLYSQLYKFVLDDEGNPTTEVGEQFKVGDKVLDFTTFDPTGKWIGTDRIKGQKNTVLEFNSSKHAAIGLACVDCHDPHSMEIKAPADDPEKLCQSCHADKGADHKMAIHDMVGATCMDCHATAIGSTATMWDNGTHDFKVISPTESLANYDALIPYSRNEGTDPQLQYYFNMAVSWGPGCYANGPYVPNSYVCTTAAVLPNACASCHKSEMPTIGIFNDVERAKLLKGQERWQRFEDASK
ncbi:Ig-like domain-containing protein [Shewanella atlantica]|uniref:Ig-like domain-containing protein n=2 Tax=Shewanella TaxID=22 RepID=UPI0037366687